MLKNGTDPKTETKQTDKQDKLPIPSESLWLVI